MIKVGQRYRVKCTKILREFGVRCGGAWADANDKRLWPKDIGTVVEYQGNGWKGLKLEFSRGRTLQIGTLYSDSEGWEIETDRMKDFVKVKGS